METYEAPEVFDLGEAEELTMGTAIIGDPDSCGGYYCDIVIDSERPT